MEPEKLSFKLEVFEGPLDLLLHLISKNQVDIYDIPIEDITRQYFEYLNTAQEFDMEIGSEFLVMAAQLLYIKSKMLLPNETNTENIEDPRTQLVAKLLDYQAYKELASFLRDKENDGDIFYYHEREKFDFAKIDYSHQSFDLSDLTQAFYEVLNRKTEWESVQNTRNLQAIATHREYSILDKIYEVKEKVEEKRKIWFRNILQECTTRGECIATFLAILEMIKSSLIQLEFVPKEHDYILKDGVKYEQNT